MSTSSITKQTSSVPRLLPLKQYTEQHVKDVKELIKAVEATQDASLRKRLVHKRRRTRSYRKASFATEIGKTGRRGRSKLIRDRRRRNARLQWRNKNTNTVPWKLETHFWLAKRFKMIPKWKCLLPERSLGTSSCTVRVLQDLSVHCILHDSSYWRSLLVYGETYQIQNAFVQLSIPSLVTRKFHKDGFLKGGIEIILPVFNSGQSSKRFIGFIKTMLLSAPEYPTQKRLIVWIHPHVYEDIFKAFEVEFKSQVEVKELRLQRLELCGGKSLEILQQVIPDLPFEEINSMQSGSVIKVRCQDPRLLSNSCVSTDNLPNQQKKSLSSIIISGEEELVPVTDKDIESYRQNLRKKNVYEEIEENEHHLKVESFFVPCWLIIHQSTSSIRCSLCVPKMWAMPFWKQLVLKGCKVAGIEDFAHVKTALQELPYPEAFFCCLSKELVVCHREQQQDLQTGEKYVFMKIHIRGKGRCQLGAEVFMPSGAKPGHLSFDTGSFGSVVWSLKTGIHGYPGGFALCNLLLLAKTLSFAAEQLLQYTQEIQILVRNPRSSVFRTAVGRIYISTDLNTDTS